MRTHFSKILGDSLQLFCCRLRRLVGAPGVSDEEDDEATRQAKRQRRAAVQRLTAERAARERRLQQLEWELLQEDLPPGWGALGLPKALCSDISVEIPMYI